MLHKEKLALARECEALVHVGAHTSVVSLRYAAEQEISGKHFLLAFLDYINPPITLQHFMECGDLYRGASVEEVASVMTGMSGDLISAVQHVHQARVGHQDIKPDNIMKLRGRNSWKLCDYGVGINLKSHKDTENIHIG